MELEECCKNGILQEAERGRERMTERKKQKDKMTVEEEEGDGEEDS